ncbi:hypothetical protein [Frankia nepalensis]|uniref:DUF4913 domain-containing protein n=1 Tax=Frankia nepalensis TaxID=1836974 RepID=A0A937RA56_9ACTN|nr:hypothetical protein [Frankia nepalensis]MBL7501546.1 hypothetical protein [Frankia nepalensis]MBL7515565.1 hypothetical protein [Frankia nepalensis]MBL7626705.1 hypothetical protein [Frankia nepalensis]
MTGEAFAGRGESLDELMDIVSQLVDRVLALEQHEQQRRRVTAAGAPFRWEDLAPDQLRHTWHELGTWVRWLCARYRVDDIPPCWYQHGDLVEELTALWLAWQGAYRADARPDDPVRWLDWLARARARIARRSPRCGAGAHRKLEPAESHDEVSFAAFVQMRGAAAAASRDRRTG